MKPTTSKRTPGPWKVSNDDATRINGGGRPYSIVVAETCGYQGAREANARLIAAAPDLLAALKTAKQCALGFGERSAIVTAQIDAAIAKAEGNL